MPTADRPEWVEHSIEMFLRQTVPGDRELIVVDDGAVGLTHEIAAALDHPAIDYVRLDQRLSMGAKRNLAIARARGDVIVQWDDDDWYGPDRLERQIAPIRDGSADITGFVDAVWFDVGDWRFRRPHPETHRRIFVEDVHGGTLAFSRVVVERLGVRYPDASLAEDAQFLRAAMQRGARLERLRAEDTFVYVRHGTNSWRFGGGDGGWDDVPEPLELAADREFYAARSTAAPASPARAPVPVSCIMPTADRPHHLVDAIESFLAQRFAACELVITDDGCEPVDHLVPGHPRVRYVRFDRHIPLGEKRNRSIEAATGEIIVHFDDDDWSHPERVGRQLDVLRRTGAAVCGLSTLLWWDAERGAAYRYTCPPLHRAWVAGNTLAYRRDSWQRSGFPALDCGEDTAFVWGHPGRTVEPIDDERLVIGRIHGSNTSRKTVNSSAWTRVDDELVRRVFLDAGARVPWGS